MYESASTNNVYDSRSEYLTKQSFICTKKRLSGTRNLVMTKIYLSDTTRRMMNSKTLKRTLTPRFEYLILLDKLCPLMWLSDPKR